jgi:hypothetical protein
MGYLIAYLLFALVVDLLLELVNPKRRSPATIATHRRLWNDSLFDCRSQEYATDAPTSRRFPRRLTGPLKG